LKKQDESAETARVFWPFKTRWAPLGLVQQVCHVRWAAAQHCG